MKKKVMCAVLSTAMAVSMVASVATTSPVSAAAKLSGTITFATHRTDVADTTLKELAKQFMKEHSGTKIEIEALKDAPTVLATRMAANELPDITLVLADKIPQSKFKNYFANLDDLGFTENNLYQYSFGVGTDKHLYGLNSAVSYDGIVYNKKAFKKAGVTKTPRTMTEFYAACAKLKKAGIIPLAINYKDKWPLDVYGTNAVMAVAQTGNASYGNNLANKGVKLLDSKVKGGLLDTFNFLRTMKSKGYLEPDLMSTNWDSMKKQMATGKIAMAALGTWFPPQLVDNGAKKADIGMFPYPDAKVIGQGGDYMYAVAKNSKNIPLAKAFLKWMWEDGRYADATMQASPVKTAAVKDPAIKELLSYGVKPLAGVPGTVKYTNTRNKFQKTFSDVLQEYLLASDSSLKSIINNYNTKWEASK
jgi:raffinose/stachyose/melibiose transport system substrate-binding protein